MSAANALKASRDAGVSLHVDGDDLVLEASTPPRAAILALLSSHKAGVIALLRPDFSEVPSASSRLGAPDTARTGRARNGA